MNEHGYQMIEVGKRWPGQVVPVGGNFMSMRNMIHTLHRMRHPTEDEITAFKSIHGYGFYQGPDLPHGVLIWYFGPCYSCETPFNPRLEETLRHREVQRFLNREINACQRILLDERGIVRAIGLLGLDWELVDILRQTWTDPDLDWSEYDNRYADLTLKRSPEDLWNMARKWTVRSA